jgi:hypothetical protein
MLASSGDPFRLLQSKILDNVHIITLAQAMNTLSVGTPRIMIVALFRINSWCTEHLPGEGNEEDINSREF